MVPMPSLTGGDQLGAMYCAQIMIGFHGKTEALPPSGALLSVPVLVWRCARGLYHLPGKWLVSYSVNAGTGESDLTWGAQAGIGNKIQRPECGARLALPDV